MTVVLNDEKMSMVTGGNSVMNADYDPRKKKKKTKGPHDPGTTTTAPEDALSGSK